MTCDDLRRLLTLALLVNQECCRICFVLAIAAMERWASHYVVNWPSRPAQSTHDGVEDDQVVRARGVRAPLEVRNHRVDDRPKDAHFPAEETQNSLQLKA